MGVLDDHNRQHTYGNSLGPPTSVVGVSAQQAIDASKRLQEQGGQGSSGGQPLRWRDHLKIALVALAMSAVVAVAAYLVGGFGAVALGLVAVVSGLFGSIFLFIALVDGVTTHVTNLRRDGYAGAALLRGDKGMAYAFIVSSQAMTDADVVLADLLRHAERVHEGDVPAAVSRAFRPAQRFVRPSAQWTTKMLRGVGILDCHAES